MFVYGSLKPGGQYWHTYCEGKLSDEPIEARIQGELYDLNVGYPGLLLQGENWVIGWILKFANKTDFLNLDYLEGYVPNQPKSDNEYNGVVVDCYTLSGKYLDKAWTYEMTSATAQRHDNYLIDEGVWPI